MIVHFKSGVTQSMPERRYVTEAAEKRKQEQAKKETVPAAIDQSSSVKRP